MATVSSAPEGFTARQILAANLRRLRSVRGWSQEELAFECDLHRTFIAHVERCGRNISLDNLERLSQALQVPVFELLLPHANASNSD